MGPKPPSADSTKSLALLALIRDSNTAHTLKELEKTAPGPTGISAMQVKDHLQALVDESLVRVEKIGSGNWYWSFLSEEKKARERTLETLRQEAKTLASRVSALEEELGTNEESEEEKQRRLELQERYDGLHGRVAELRERLKAYEGADPQVFAEKQRRAEDALVRFERWTDNVFILESWFLQLTGGDRSALEELRQSLYGDEYAEGEGLRELEL